MPRDRSYLDIAAALVVAAAAAFTTAYSYALIRDYESDQIVLFSGLEPGQTRHILSSAGKCVGTLTTDFGHTDSALLTGQLQLRLIAGGNRGNATGEFEFHFNPLGQMHLGRVILSSPGVRGVVQSERVKPISLHATFSVGKQNYDHTFVVDGPIELDRKGEQYRIVMPSRKHSTTAVAGTIVETLLPQIEISPDAASSTACSAGDAIDLDSVNRALSGPLFRMFSSIPGAK